MPGLSGFESIDPVLLSRMQFAVNITFHIIFPAMSIGLSWLLLFFKLRHARTGNAAWLDTYRFWIKVFALTFAIGIVTGVVMSFQFGTNWPGFMNTVGNVAGPLLAYEVPKATRKVASVCTRSDTRRAPNSMMPRKLASRKKAVSTS